MRRRLKARRQGRAQALLLYAQRTGDTEALAAAVAAYAEVCAELSPRDRYRYTHLVNFGSALHFWGQVTGEEDAVREAILLYQRALGGLPPGARERGAFLGNLGHALTSLFLLTQEEARLEEGIDVLRQAVQEAEETRDRAALATFLANLGDGLELRHRLTRDPAALDESIAVLSQVVAMTPADHPYLVKRLRGLGEALRERIESAGARPGEADLSAAIEVYRRLAELDAPQVVQHLSNLGTLLAMSARDWARAIDIARRALELTPVDDPARPLRQANLGGALLERARSGGTPADESEGLDLLRQAMAGHAAAEPAVRWPTLFILGTTLLERGGPDVLDEAVHVLREAGGVAEGPVRAKTFACLGQALLRTAELRPSVEGYAEAVAVGRRALELAAAGERAACAANLATMLAKQAQALQHAESLDEAIRVYRDLAAAHGTADPVVLDNLAAALVQRGDPRALEEAVAARRAAIAATPAGDAEGRRARLSRLAFTLQEQAEQDPAALPEAVAAYRAAVAATTDDRLRSDLLALLAGRVARLRPDDDEPTVLLGQAMAALPADAPERLPTLLSLARQQQSRFISAGNAAALESAISAFREAVDGLGDDGPAHADALSGLGGALVLRFELRGDPADLEAGIDLQRRAAQATALGSGEWTVRWTNTATALLHLSAGENSAAIQEAISIYRRILHQTGEHRGRGDILANLGAALLGNVQMGDAASLPEAVEVLREAVKQAPSDRSRRIIVQGNLGSALAEQFAVNGDKEALREAVAVYRQVYADTPDTHPHRLSSLSNLGTVLYDWFNADGDRAVLAEAAEIMRAGLRTVSADPRRAACLNTFGLVLAKLAADAGDQAEALWDEALAACRQAMEQTTAPAVTRARAADNLGHIARERGDLATALDGFATAVGLLDEAAGNGMRRRDQERILTLLPNLASNAAACAIRLGRPEHAIELLEQGRGVLLAQAMDARTPVDRLRAVAPGLADELVAVFERLESMPDELQEPLPGMGHSADRVALARRKATLLQQVRTKVPGFADFLLPPRFATLRQAGAQGPVAIVNVSHVGCDALVIPADGPVIVVPLNDLTLDQVDDYTTLFHMALDALRRRPSPREPTPRRPILQRILDDLLTRLWDTVAEPVLAGLGITGPPSGGAEWPRLWWCLTGPLSLLPLHAAGRHTAEGTGATVLDRVVSSSTPTLRALLRARQQDADAGDTDARPLVVALPRTPGQRDLPAAEDERRDYLRLLPRAGSLTGASATSAAVLDSLARSPWVHFACHGMQDVSAPSSGHLLLHDGALTVRDISRLRLKNAEFAFLSACDTSRGGSRLADEALSMANAMQLAGYRRVIATLWPVSDLLAAEVARSVYERMVTGGTLVPAASASALHHVIRELRDQLPGEPDLWATHVHTGP
ncbi:CHAT domain-containing protein [Nonomuraea sp. NPDC049400]|uniref:CHAT domain-containing protein n=1 Tax=Nonomuraea sp. NPDC049400 TaxID=3364352 RepID=UPI00378EDCBC